MKIIVIFNRFLWLVALISFFVFATQVDYRFLVDPVYYVEASQLSINFFEAIKQGERWSTDIFFIIYSFLLGVISNDFNTIAILFVTSLIMLLFSALYKYTKSVIFILLLFSVTVSFSTFGLFFNVWRQGFAVLLITLTAVYFNRLSIYFLFFAVGFHLNSAIFFLPAYFFKKIKDNINIFLPLTILILVPLVLFLVVNVNLFINSFLVYANVEAKIALLRNMFGNVLLLCFLLNVKFFVKKSMRLRDSLIFKFTLSCLVFSTIFLIIAPSASERLMYYFFMIYPFLLCEFYRNFNIYGRSVVILIFLIFISVSMYFLFRSQTWNNLVLFSVF
ncbi:EpsG family protein [Shewanella sp. YIC-542]|uniref:EpsG family protein n=1 Tax=Shewanella mytili TaxID=3377111 RepID=UPI00398F235F